MHHSLDLAAFGAFVFLWVGIILFRRFHQYETLVRPKDLGPTAWGLYGPNQEQLPLPAGRRAKLR